MFLARAMEIGRMSPDQVDLLHSCEVKNRALQPYEIQILFGLPQLKEHYQLPPEDLNAQAVHNQRLRGDFRRAGIYPDGGDMSGARLDTLHAFDNRFLLALAENKINLFYMGPTETKRKRITDSL
jgi:hypothetical protein